MFRGTKMRLGLQAIMRRVSLQLMDLVCSTSLVSHGRPQCLSTLLQTRVALESSCSSWEGGRTTDKSDTGC